MTIGELLMKNIVPNLKCCERVKAICSLQRKLPAMEYTGSSYDGGVESRRFEGRGEFQFPNGIKYVGEFVDGGLQHFSGIFKKNSLELGPFFHDITTGFGVNL